MTVPCPVEVTVEVSTPEPLDVTAEVGVIYHVSGESFAFDDLTDVHAPSPSDGQVPTWVAANSRYELLTPSDAGGTLLHAELTDTDTDGHPASVIALTQTTPGDWATDPETVQEALDELAARDVPQTTEQIQDLVGAMAGDGLTYNDGGGILTAGGPREIVIAPADGTHTYIDPDERGVYPWVAARPSVGGPTEATRAHVVFRGLDNAVGTDTVVVILPPAAGATSRAGVSLGAMAPTPGVLGDMATWVASNPPLNWEADPLTFVMGVNDETYDIVLDANFAAAGLVGQSIFEQLVALGAPVTMAVKWLMPTDDTEPSTDPGDVLEMALVTTTRGTGSVIEIVDPGEGDPLGLLTTMTSYPGASEGQILWGVNRSHLMAGHGHTHHAADGDGDPGSNNVAPHQAVHLGIFSDLLGPYLHGLGPSMRSEYVTFQPQSPFFDPDTKNTGQALNALGDAVADLEAGGGGGLTDEQVQDLVGAMVTGNVETGASVTYDDTAGKLDVAVAYGTTAGTAAQGNDSRLSDARTPTAHKTSHATGGSDALTAADVGADPAGSAAAAQTYAAGLVDDLSGVTDQATARTNLGLGDSATRAVGTTAGTVTAGDDSRLSDARTPTAHKTSHATGGSDALTAADIGAVPTSRTVAGHALSGDVTITAADVGAATTSHSHAASDIASGTVDAARLPSVVPLYGTGADGDATLGAGTTTLTQDAHYSNLTVPSGATLDTAGFRLLVSGTLAGAGTISANGASVGNSSSAASNTATGVYANSGSAGGSGSTGSGAQASAAIANGIGGSGGAGGNGTGSNTGGAQRSVAAPVAAAGGSNLKFDLWAVSRGQVIGSGGTRLSGGTGGGGGAGDGSVAGGGGGAGGGVVFAAARTVTFTGSIEAKGGNGGTRTTGNTGGGGGGGGGMVMVVTASASQTFTTSVTGGTGGTGTGTGTSGGNGVAGTAVVYTGVK